MNSSKELSEVLNSKAKNVNLKLKNEFINQRVFKSDGNSSFRVYKEIVEVLNNNN